MGASATSPFAHRLNRRALTEGPRGVIIWDRSNVGRTGFKGAGTTNWLATRVHLVPDRPNRAVKLPHGTLIARLGKEEYLVLDGCVTGMSQSAELEASWYAQNKQTGGQIGYPLPRADSHSWLYLEGNDVPKVMAKICGVDLRPGTCPPGDIVQTFVARIGAVLIREITEKTYGLHMLTDFASADYLWDVLEDATAEFGGGFAAAGRA